MYWLLSESSKQQFREECIKSISYTHLIFTNDVFIGLTMAIEMGFLN